MELRYKTNGMGNPKGKPYVYFSCHPKDFDLAFPLVSEDILAHSNCAIWYDSALELPAEEETVTSLDEEELGYLGTANGLLIAHLKLPISKVHDVEFT